MQRPFQQVDVFSREPLAGNPVAVVLDGTGLSTARMQRFAAWTNLSETTFVLPPTTPQADYRVRIFTPTDELPFAGHPTLGTCHAWLRAGGAPRDPEVVVQECDAGLVAVRRGEAGLAFAAPPLLRAGPLEPAHRLRLVEALGLAPGEVVDAQWVDNGPGWVALLLESAERVLSVVPDPTRTGEDPFYVGVVGPYPPGSPCAFEVRAFFPAEAGALREDPVTGSLNASLAQWLLASGRTEAPYVAAQGTRLGRSGRVTIRRDPEGTVWVEGATVTYLEGTVELPPDDGERAAEARELA